MASNPLSQFYDDQNVDEIAEDGRQFLSFVVDDEEYGVDILQVQEIRGWSKVTRIPNMPEYIRGVLNLRGAVVPIIDLRMRFGLPALEYGPTTVVVVLRVRRAETTRDMGVVVDGVSEVYAVPVNSIRPPPDFGGHIRSDFVQGLATLEEKMVILLDVDRLLNSEELAVADTATQKADLQP